MYVTVLQVDIFNRRPHVEVVQSREASGLRCDGRQDFSYKEYS